MKLPSLAVCKLLCLIAIGLVGYELHPALFPQQMDDVQEIVEAAPEPVVIKETVTEPTPSFKIRPHTMATKPELPEIVEIAPAPEKPNPQPEPKEISPIESATLVLVGKEASSTTEIKKDADLIERACYYGEWTQYRAMLARSLTEATLHDQGIWLDKLAWGGFLYEADG